MWHSSACFLSQLGTNALMWVRVLRPPRWPSGEDIRLESGRSRVRIPLALDFFGVESYQSFRNWLSSGYPARRLAL